MPPRRSSPKKTGIWRREVQGLGCWVLQDPKLRTHPGCIQTQKQLELSPVPTSAPMFPGPLKTSSPHCTNGLFCHSILLVLLMTWTKAFPKNKMPAVEAFPRSTVGRSLLSWQCPFHGQSYLLSTMFSVVKMTLKAGLSGHHSGIACQRKGAAKKRDWGLGTTKQLMPSSFILRMSASLLQFSPLLPSEEESQGEEEDWSGTQTSASIYSWY